MCVYLAVPGYAQMTGGPKISAGVIEGVGDAWQTITLPETYSEMVVVAIPAYTSNQKPAVTRIRDVKENTFEVRVQNPSGEALSGYKVHYMAVEAGVYSYLQDGIHLEAFVLASEDVAHSQNWSGERINYSNDYVSPVILGQVMSYNDSRWSVFWASGFFASSPPNDFAFVGRHVGEDEDRERGEEEIGYIIVESSIGKVNGYTYQAFLGEDTIQGIDGSAPYSYVHSVGDPDVGLLASAGMDGVNGGWPVLWGEAAVDVGQLSLAIDEDQVGDSERQHTTEQVAVLILEKEQVFPQISFFEPQAGEAGTVVTVGGALLSTIEQVYMGDVLVSDVEIQNEQELEITVPDGADTGVIRLIGNDGFELVSSAPFVITYAEAETGINLCRLTQAVASQSSFASSDSGAENACDGVLLGSLEDASIAATSVENESWWEVDLGAVFNISNVEIRNGLDCCQEGADYFVFISDAPFVSKSAQVTLADPSVRTYFVNQGGNAIDIDIGHEGRYVRLQYPGEGAFGLSEVEVIAANGMIVNVGRSTELELASRLELTTYPLPASDVAHVSYALPGPGHVNACIV